MISIIYKYADKNIAFKFKLSSLKIALNHCFGVAKAYWKTLQKSLFGRLASWFTRLRDTQQQYGGIDESYCAVV